jgi:hypothetical protein
VAKVAAVNDKITFLSLRPFLKELNILISAAVKVRASVKV